MTFKESGKSVIAGFAFIAVTSYLVSVAQGPVVAGTPCGSTVAISDVATTDVASKTTIVSWQADLSLIHI